MEMVICPLCAWCSEMFGEDIMLVTCEQCELALWFKGEWFIKEKLITTASEILSKEGKGKTPIEFIELSTQIIPRLVREHSR